MERESTVPIGTVHRVCTPYSWFNRSNSVLGGALEGAIPLQLYTRTGTRTRVQDGHRTMGGRETPNDKLYVR